MNLFLFSGSVGSVHNHLTIAVLKTAPAVPGSQPLVHTAAAAAVSGQLRPGWRSASTAFMLLPRSQNHPGPSASINLTWVQVADAEKKARQFP